MTKKLVLRLSSLGDVILATSILEVHSFLKESHVDWVVAQEFSEVLCGHPKIHRVIQFNRSQGLRAWVRFCYQLWLENYLEIFDLHLSLRTRLMKLLFAYWSWVEQTPKPKWKTISKQYRKLFFYYLLKRFCPLRWRPLSWVSRFTLLAGGSGTEHPNLKHLVRPFSEVQSLFFSKGEICDLSRTKFLCLMPSSRWKGKMWPVDFYFKLVQSLSQKFALIPIILGQKSDLASVSLLNHFEVAGLSCCSALGVMSLAQTATVLHYSIGYLGSDTGLAHLAEAVGVPARIIFGPTTPDMGFGPWMKESRSIELSLWCRPCGKDGRYCFRIKQKYLCLKGLLPDQVVSKYFESLE